MCKLKHILLLLAVIFSIRSVSAVEKSEIIEEAKLITNIATTLYNRGYHQNAIDVINEFLIKFESYPKEITDDMKYISGWRYYYLACFYSDNKDIDHALKSLKKAMDAGLSDDPNAYYSMKSNSMLDNLRDTAYFKALFDTLTEKHDYLVLLKRSGEYKTDDVKFTVTYQTADNAELKALKEYFRLDSIAGSGDELSKIKRLLNFVNGLIPHDGTSGWRLGEKPSSVLEIAQLCVKYNHPTTCRNLARILNECYLAMGIKSRYITCYPKKYISDCHVINAVWSTQLKKWLWVDPTQNAMVMDERGNYLSIAEVRNRLRSDMPMQLNEDARLNKGDKVYKTDINDYLYSYMAKNLYFIEIADRYQAGMEFKNRGESSVVGNDLDEHHYVLVPSDYNPNTDVVGREHRFTATTDEILFWQKPQ